MGMALCELCQKISPETLTAEWPHKLPSGLDATGSGYKHLANFEDLPQSARGCSLCKLLLDNLQGPTMKLKAHRKPHSIILMSDTHRSDRTAPCGVAGMTALVQNSDLRAYFHVYALPGKPRQRQSDS